MFDWNVSLMTLENVGILFAFLAAGYLLRQMRVLPDNADSVMSRLVTYLFCPAYSIATLSQSITRENLGGNLTMFAFGALIIAACFVLSFFLGKLWGRSDFERKTLIYAFAITNFGYFGYPVVGAVFGAKALADMMIFCIPITLVTNTVGYILFAPKGAYSWKKVFCSPLVLAVWIGIAVGLSGLTLPSFVTGILTGAGNCMSPVSMILAGYVLGALPVTKLVQGVRPYLFGMVRLVLLPALFVAICYIAGLRGMYLMIPGLYLALPLGMNLVVFPASFGYDTRDNAKMCFISLIMSVVTLPLIFGILYKLAGL